MLFYIVEVRKEDCVIYDVENGGVCCCSLYTLNQLKSMGHEIKGFDGRKVWEVDLQGKKRENKAPKMCEDDTKRSAVTIAKGLSEKKYPRIKRTRIVETSKIYKINYNNRVVLGFLTQEGCLVLMNGVVIDRDIVHKYNIVEVPKVDKVTKEYLLKIKAMREKVTYITEKIKKLEEEKNKEINDIKGLYEEYIIRQASESVTGEECGNMSFHNGTLDILRVKAIISKTKRKILYTHGLKYRHPTTYMVEISKDSAYDILKHNTMIDVNMEKDYIEINTFSDNDMW